MVKSYLDKLKLGSKFEAPMPNPTVKIGSKLLKEKLDI